MYTCINQVRVFQLAKKGFKAVIWFFFICSEVVYKEQKSMSWCFLMVNYFTVLLDKAIASNKPIIRVYK